MVGAVCVLCLVLAGLLPAGCASTPQTIEIVTVSQAVTPATPRKLAGYHATLARVVEALEDELGLPRIDVALVLFPSRKAFELGLAHIGYSPELARAASAFHAIAGAKAVLMNAGAVDGFDEARRTRLIAHELVHSLQYRFSGGTRGASEQWLREGFAEWVACRVTARARLGSFASLRDEVFRPFAGVPVGLPPVPLDRLVTFQQWVEAQRRYDAPVYVQAFLGAELLIERHGVPAVVTYFERFQATTEHERAFRESFGLDRAEFERLLAERWHQTLLRFSALR